MAGMRSLCSATITFGLLCVPVKIYNTAREEGVEFKMISKSGNRVKMQFRDAITDEVVDKTTCNKGFEIDKENLVVFTEEELSSLAGAKNNYIEIDKVVSDINLSPACVEKAFYLSPGPGADKAYQLLVRVLSATKKAAVCSWKNRGKDNLVAVVASGDILMMFQMYYKNELNVLLPKFDKNSVPSDREIDLASKLLEQLSGTFDLGDYKDQYVERVKDAVAKKQAGGILEVLKEEKLADGFDLVALLENSLKKNVG